MWRCRNDLGDPDHKSLHETLFMQAFACPGSFIEKLVRVRRISILLNFYGINKLNPFS
jgi:hypothetical protein